jgi:hypothetical protein
MRAKTINEIRREGDALRAIDAGRERALRTMSIIRREIPSLITDVTMTAALADYARRTNTPEDVDEYTKALIAAIDGSPDDYVKVDFVDRAMEEEVNQLYHRLIPDDIETYHVFKKDYWTYHVNGRSDEYVGDRKIYYYPTMDVVLILMWDKPKGKREVSLNAVFVRSK